MKAKLKYVLPLIVTFCFLEAAFEIDQGNVKNKWQDEYDIYIPSASASIRLVFNVGHDTELVPWLHVTFFQFGCLEKLATITLASGRAICPSQPDLYISNCTLLI